MVSSSFICAAVLFCSTIDALNLPYELWLSGGSALGAYIASSSGQSMKMLLTAVPQALRRNPYEKETYMQLMALLYVLLNKARRDGLMSVEGDIEEPYSSPIF